MFSLQDEVHSTEAGSVAVAVVKRCASVVSSSDAGNILHCLISFLVNDCFSLING